MNAVNQETAVPETEGVPPSEPTSAASAAASAEDGEKNAPVGEKGTYTKLKELGKKALVFAIIAISAILLYVIVNIPAVTNFCRSVIKHTRPVIIGGVIAYLCNPILRFYEYRVFRRMKHSGARKGLSLFLTVLTFFVIITLVVVLILPQLISSISDLFNNYESYLNGMLAFLQGYVDKITANLPVDINISSLENIQEYLVEMYGSVEDFFSDEILPLIQNWDFGSAFGSIMDWAGTFVNVAKDTFIGLFIAFYILAAKDRCAAQIKKFRCAVLTEKQNARVCEVTTLVHKSFGGFISGKIIDSLIIGVLSFVVLSIFHISPYNVLIATFIGVTNIIPVFGPFIGAIPSFLIVLISSPSKALLFLLLVLIIQQIDGNIIGPKILGDNTGVSSLTVIISITICGSLWGIVGMLVGVPIFAVVIELVKRRLEEKLIAKGQPTDTVAYYAKNAVADADKEVHYEHTSLLYSYEHSKLKPRIDRMREILNTRFKTSKKKKAEPPQDNSADESDDESDEDIK